MLRHEIPSTLRTLEPFDEVGDLEAVATAFRSCGHSLLSKRKLWPQLPTGGAPSPPPLVFSPVAALVLENS